MSKIRKPLLSCLIILFLILLFPACSNSTQITPEPCVHKFQGWTIIKESTCLEDGVQTNTCSACGYTETQSIPISSHTEVIDHAIKASCTVDGKTQGKHCAVCNLVLIAQETITAVGHKYDGGKVTIKATCMNEGVKTYTCDECGYAYTEVILKTPHQYNDGIITTHPSCEGEGETTYSCIVCGNNRIETIESLGHDPDLNHVCTRCDIILPIKLTMTESEIKQANKINGISDTSIENQKDENRFCLTFSLQDSFGDYLKAPIAVEIEIKNNDNIIVFKGAKAVKTNDFFDSINAYGKKITIASIYINYSEIAEGTTSKGKINFKFYNDYVCINAFPLTIHNDLPVTSSTVILPILPTIINDYTYDGNIDSSVRITSVTYEIIDNDLKILFTGEKVYDLKGDKNRQPCKVKWNLYDSEGYLLASNTFYSSSIAVGEKFQNETDVARNVIIHGRTYSLQISHLN